MTTRRRRIYVFLALAFVGGLLSTPAQGAAQRSGFIVGFGLGPGYNRQSYSGSSGSQTGVAMDFHLGGVVGNGLEIYWMQKATYSGSEDSNISLVASGVGGIGFAYPVTPKVYLHGGIGRGVLIEVEEGGTQTVDSEGLGLVGGGRYELDESGRWMLNLDVMYGKPSSGLNVLGLQLTINVMSH